MEDYKAKYDRMNEMIDGYIKYCSLITATNERLGIESFMSHEDVKEILQEIKEQIENEQTPWLS